jgi:hypothetical protein
MDVRELDVELRVTLAGQSVDAVLSVTRSRL